MKETIEDKVMAIDRLQTEYQMLLSGLQQKGFCNKQDRSKLLEYFDRVDRIRGIIYE